MATVVLLRAPFGDRHCLSRRVCPAYFPRCFALPPLPPQQPSPHLLERYHDTIELLEGLASSYFF